MAEEITPPTPPADPTPPVTTATTPPPEQTTPPSKFVERLTKLGFESVASDEDAFDRLASAFEQERQQHADQIKQIVEEVRGQVPPQTPPQPGEKPRWWNPPQADLNVAARYRTPDGNWKPETPHDVRQSVEALEAYRNQFASKLVADPEAALAPLLEQKFEEYFERKYGQVTAEQQEKQFFERLTTEHDWLWDKDPISKRPTRNLSAEGKRFNELMIEGAERFGISSRTKQFEYAMERRAAEQAASRQITPEQAREANDKHKADLLGRFAPPANRGGSLPPGKPATNKNLSFGQRVLQNLQSGT